MATKRICSVPDCGKPHDSRGYCAAHANRFRKYGDPLGGSTFHGEPAAFMKRAMRYDGKDCLIWPFMRNSAGYPQIHIGRKCYLVTRIICREIHGEPPLPDSAAAHSCGKGHLGCISPSHLSWKTRVENMADTLIHGTHNRGERHGMARLTRDDVRDIRKLAHTLPHREIAEAYGIAKDTVSNIKRRKYWAWLD